MSGAGFASSSSSGGPSIASHLPLDNVSTSNPVAATDGGGVRERRRARRALARSLVNVPDLGSFMKSSAVEGEGMAGGNAPQGGPYMDPGIEGVDSEGQLWSGRGRTVAVETYGCQMNVNDTEIVQSIMSGAGYEAIEDSSNADVVLLNTCAIRDRAEHKVWKRLEQLRAERKNRPGMTVGVLGCMAERLKASLLEEEGMVDVVVGPDAYRDLPRLLVAGSGAVNVALSLEETYADVAPLRRLGPAQDQGPLVNAWVSISRGCNHMCSYCIVPFTRGRERARPIGSIESEVASLVEEGVREITLLGQNVNSYQDMSSIGSVPEDKAPMAAGFGSIVMRPGSGVRFAELLDRVATLAPDVRFRFTSPHPAHFPDEVLEVVATHPNVAKAIHMPAQSGSTAMLKAMRRGHTREAYLDLVENLRRRIPKVGLSSDFISGFCGETEEDHRDTVALLEQVRYDQCFMFAYSMRPGTHAHRRLDDNIPAKVKQARLAEVISTFHRVALEKNQEEIGDVELVLVEGASRRSDQDLSGRADSNKRVVFPDPGNVQVGDFVPVRITGCTSSTMKGEAISGATSLREFHRRYREESRV